MCSTDHALVGHHLPLFALTLQTSTALVDPEFIPMTPLSFEAAAEQRILLVVLEEVPQ